MGTDRPLAAIPSRLGRLVREISRDTDRDPGARAPKPGQFPRPVLPHVAVLRHGQAPLVRTTRGGSKARGLLSGRYEKFFMYELIGQGTITNIYNNLAMAMYVTPCQACAWVIGYGGWGMGHLISGMGHGLSGKRVSTIGYEAVGCGMWAVGCGLWGMGYGLWVLGYPILSIRHRVSSRGT
jgi:hypothetical protein